jgi:hypothetical protein
MGLNILNLAGPSLSWTVRGWSLNDLLVLLFVGPMTVGIVEINDRIGHKDGISVRVYEDGFLGTLCR